MDQIDISAYANQLLTILIGFLPSLFSAILIYFVGSWFIRLFKNFIVKVLKKREVEPTLSLFLTDILNWVLKILLLITIISQLGIQSSSFVAILGAAGLAIGLSLQGSLANFAGGVLIITFKPFKVGDFIEAQGVNGTVDQIQIFVTRLITVDNQIIYVPNGNLSNNTIINFSQSEYRRADLTIGISYSSDIKAARALAFEVMENHPLVLKEPAPVVWVRGLGDSSVDFAIRPWAKNQDFWQMRSEILEQIKNSFDNNGIEIPFPQRDVHIKQ
jgi:small conductance mechanosensitive channel